MLICFNHGIIKYSVTYVNILYLKSFDKYNQCNLNIKRK